VSVMRKRLGINIWIEKAGLRELHMSVFERGATNQYKLGSTGWHSV